MNKAIFTDKAPAAIGPYSHAILAGKTLYVSGQLPADAATGAFSGSDIRSQTRQSLTNIGYILHEAGFDFCHVVKSTVYLKHISEFAAMNEVYAEFFQPPFPARAAYEVGSLPKDALVEIEVVAVK